MAPKVSPTDANVGPTNSRPWNLRSHSHHQRLKPPGAAAAAICSSVTAHNLAACSGSCANLDGVLIWQCTKYAPEWPSSPGAVAA